MILCVNSAKRCTSWVPEVGEKSEKYCSDFKVGFGNCSRLPHGFSCACLRYHRAHGEHHSYSALNLNAVRQLCLNISGGPTSRRLLQRQA